VQQLRDQYRNFLTDDIEEKLSNARNDPERLQILEEALGIPCGDISNASSGTPVNTDNSNSRMPVTDHCNSRTPVNTDNSNSGGFVIDNRGPTILDDAPNNNFHNAVDPVYETDPDMERAIRESKKTFAQEERMRRLVL